jgi:two-component system response regulator NreC
MERLDIVVVDDHRLFVDGLRSLLEAEEDLRVVGQAASAAEAYAIVERTSPGLVLVDVGLPQGVSGIELTRELLRRVPGQRVLILSTFMDVEHVVQALAAGARGYALKLQPALALVEAIRTVATGRLYLAPQISHFVVDERRRLGRGGAQFPGPLDVLSPRERVVFDLLVNGHSNQSVAANLSISVKTVETHRSHVMRKLRAHSLVELVRFAARHHLLTD